MLEPDNRNQTGEGFASPVVRKNIGGSTPDTILSIRDLALTFRTTRAHIVSRINMEIPRGSAIGVIGESGSGKSSICLSILRLLSRSIEVSGEIRFNDVDLLKLPTRDLNTIRRSRISMVFQDPISHLNPVRTVRSQFKECLVGGGETNATIDNHMTALMTEVGIRDCDRILSSYPHQISGGQAQRVTLAMALASHPELLIADEPTTALDVRVQAQVLSLLKKIQTSRGLSMLMVSHDLHAVADLCDYIFVLRHGHMMEEGPTWDVLRQPKHPYTQMLLNAFDGGAGLLTADVGVGCDRPRRPSSATQAPSAREAQRGMIRA